MCRGSTPKAPPPPLPTGSNVGQNGVAAPGSVGMSALENQGAPRIEEDTKDALALAALRRGSKRFRVNLNAKGEQLVKATDAWRPGLRVPTAKNPAMPTGKVKLKPIAVKPGGGTLPTNQPKPKGLPNGGMLPINTPPPKGK